MRKFIIHTLFLAGLLAVPCARPDCIGARASSFCQVQKPSPPPPQTQPGQPAAADKSESKAMEAERELQRVVEAAGPDRAALVRSLEEYLRRFPDAPRRLQVYRAIVESAMQLRDPARALEYSERIIALRPDDQAMMLLAVDLLEQAGDAHSLTKAVGYVSRLIDSIEKPAADAKPASASQSSWQTEQKKLRMSFYLIRGRLEMLRRNYDEALRDLEASYALVANAAAAMRLGEIYELQKEHEKAIDQYVLAFVLPDMSSAAAERAEVRRKLGNVWRLVHGTEAGLGERILAGYDRMAETSRAETHPARNAGAKDTYAFVLRFLDGKELRLAEMKGKILVLNFWATWCLPCRELEPLFEKVGQKYAERRDVVFLSVNADEDEASVKPFLERVKVRTTVAFADGLQEFMDIRGIPTVVVLDRAGRFTYRSQGFVPETFAADLTAAIERALAASPNAN